MYVFSINYKLIRMKLCDLVIYATSYYLKADGHNAKFLNMTCLSLLTQKRKINRK
jgi:hypothetical protein